MSKGFISDLAEELKKPLPGEAAHFILAPIHGKDLEIEFVHEEKPQPAGVLILLYRKNRDWHFILTERKSYKGVHGGQVSFPGGKKEPGDTDLCFTALREAEEEIGIDRSLVQQLGHLSELFIPPSNFIVYPLVAYTESEPVFIPDEKEVHQILEIPVRRLIDSGTLQKKNMEIRGRKITVPCFILNDKIVWGATAMILQEFKQVLSNILVP